MDRDNDPQDFDMQQITPPSQLLLLRNVTGLVLLAFGIGAAAWILISLIGLLNAQSPPALVAAATPGSGGPIVLGFPEGEVTLPADVFKPVGYLIVCLVYAVAVGLVIALINGGVALLQPDISKSLRRLADRFGRK